MRKTQQEDWPRLYYALKYTSIQPRQVQLLATLDRDCAVEMLGVATLNANGHTRQAALKALRDLGHSRALPYVLLRLGDWVPQVREAALEALHQLMAMGIADALLAHYDLIERAAGVERFDIQPVLKEIRDYLLRPDHRSAVFQALDSQQVSLRLFAYRLSEEMPDRDLLYKAASDRSPAIRLWLARLLVQRHPPDGMDLWVGLLHDPSNRVSTTTIAGLSSKQVADMKADLLALMFSDARPVREAVRYALRGTSIDFAAESRRRLVESLSDQITPGVVASLGETGNRSDYALVEPLLSSQRSRVREAAVEAVARLARDQATGRLVPLLNDSSGRVRRAVVGMLASTNVQPWLPQIRGTLTHGSEGGQTQALQLLALQGGWDILPDLLIARRSAFDKVRNRAWQDLGAWHSRYSHRGWLKPSDPVRVRLKDELQLPHSSRPEPPEWARHTWDKLLEWLNEQLRSQEAK